MLLDDRLATVLRHAAHSEAAQHTQYRQLLDLLGGTAQQAPDAPIAAAYRRLDELAGALPGVVRAAILRAPGLRLRNRALLARLAADEPQVAAAAMATAQLGEADWLALIPELPVTARGLLRHRRDLPPGARAVLERLGVRDLVLPEPAPSPAPAPAPTPAPSAAMPAARTEDPAQPGNGADGIATLVQRIEAFRRARDAQPPARAERAPAEARRAPCPAFDFATDALGAVVWADSDVAPLVHGLRLGPPHLGATAVLDEAGARALQRHLPLRGARIALAGAPQIAGHWRVDAAPRFAAGSRAFAGYDGRMRRPASLAAEARAGSDRLRELLHELRTPVGAIQGFAELIQQQLFGPVPHEYRAVAAAVAVDAARLLAGFDELDRLARLEAGAIALDEGQCDLRGAIVRLLRRLEGVLQPRGARIGLTVAGGPFRLGLAESEAMRLAWRLLATLAGALAPGETIALGLTGDGERLTLEAGLPAALADADDLFAASATPEAPPVPAGMFGIGFTLRLARAEAMAAGGRLERDRDSLRLVLPVASGRPLAAEGHGAPPAA